MDSKEKPEPKWVGNMGAYLAWPVILIVIAGIIFVLLFVGF
ncbi:MAG TPA: hypothetical protein VK843_10915 [Planctomycetota bacterium]|nr:hypothetical protein [Planctomycetota bacterium]